MNEAVRLVYREHLEEEFEVNYSATVMGEAMKWLNQNAETNSKIHFQEWTHLMNPFKTRGDIKFSTESDMDYLVLFSRLHKEWGFWNH